MQRKLHHLKSLFFHYSPSEKVTIVSFFLLILFLPLIMLTVFQQTNIRQEAKTCTSTKNWPNGSRCGVGGTGRCETDCRKAGSGWTGKQCNDRSCKSTMCCQPPVTPTPTPTPGNPTNPPPPPPGTTETPTPVPSVTATPTPTVTAGNTNLSLTICPHGIANCGDNANPSSQGNTNLQRTTRPVTVTVSDLQNNPVTTVQGTVIFDSASGTFKGTINTGTLASGQYSIKITMPQYLTKQIGVVQQITSGQQNVLPEIFLIAGDINGDNKLNILDYNAITSCFGTKQNSSSCQSKTAADLDDDGIVDGVDYNLFLREISVQNGQ